MKDKTKTYSLGFLMLVVYAPWFFLMTAGALFTKYKDNVQAPFNFAIKCGLIAGFSFLIVAFIVYLVSFKKPLLKVWIGTLIKVSLMTFIIVIIVYWMRPEYTSVISRYPY